MFRASYFGVLGLVLCLGCAGPQLGSHVVNVQAEHVDVPDEVASYSTDAMPGGVVGGPGRERLAADVASEIAKRGTVASPDGALAATASWILREANSGRTISQAPTEAQSRRFGFTGVLAGMASFGTEAEGDAWRVVLAQVPPNLPITRYGIAVSNSGRSAALVLGAVELSVEPFSRHLALNDPLPLRGEVAPRFRFAHVYLTKTDGTVEEKRMPTRKVNASYTFTTAGKYNLEVMGDGASGPVIVFNVPVYVGVEEEKLVQSSGHSTSPAEAEARMFDLLNQSRKAAGLNALLPDDELRKIALAHSTDMVEHNFFGHVSPTTGTTDDRYRNSGVIVALFGENVAEADSAESAHDGLMGSPGHRANMLGALYTHVGIAAVSTDAKQLAFTMIFGRRVSAAAVPRTAAEVEAAFLALRAKNGLPALVSDPVYRVAAAAGARAYAEASHPTSEVAVRASNAALTREVERLRTGRPGACTSLSEIVELSQLEQNPILLSPSVRRFGVGVQVHTDDHGPRLTVMIFLEGASCK